jgi:ubiquinone/menaquinone biosynthesis C-methylase UbiE
MEQHVCPWYLGYVLANPIRRLYQNPEKILGYYIKQGMRVLEVGPGMGFFSLPMAKLVGVSGKVFCVDLQDKMLRGLQRRAKKKNLFERIEICLCSESSLQIANLAMSIDFVLVFAVMHEVPDQSRLLKEVSRSLKKGGLLLISEPRGHVTKEEFEITLSFAQNVGMKIKDTPVIRGSYSVLLEKA